MKELEEMIVNEIERTKEGYLEFITKYKELSKRSCEYFNDKRIDADNQELRNKTIQSFRNQRRTMESDYRYYYGLSYYGEDKRNEKIEKAVRKHFESLQAKVEKKIGKIIKIEKTGNNGYDYYMKSETNSCSVEVILAGGYNIQRLHTRWIIKK